MSVAITPSIKIECFICGKVMYFGSGELYFNKNAFCSHKCLEFIQSNTLKPAFLTKCSV
jgi:ribosomal protein L24E